MVKAVDAMYAIKAEHDLAIQKFKPFYSPHDGYAIILEEVDELWEAVKMKEDGIDEEGRTRNEAMFEEAKQLGAMALRFMVDLDFRSLEEKGEVSCTITKQPCRGDSYYCDYRMHAFKNSLNKTCRDYQETTIKEVDK